VPLFTYDSATDTGQLLFAGLLVDGIEP